MEIEELKKRGARVEEENNRLKVEITRLTVSYTSGTRQWFPDQGGYLPASMRYSSLIHEGKVRAWGNSGRVLHPARWMVWIPRPQFSHPTIRIRRQTQACRQRVLRALPPHSR